MKQTLPPLSIGNRSAWLPLSPGAANLLLNSLVDAPYPTEGAWELGISCDPALTGWLLKKLVQPEPLGSISELAKAACDFARSGELATQLVWSPSSPTEPNWKLENLLGDLATTIGGQTSLAGLTSIASRWLRDQAGNPFAAEQYWDQTSATECERLPPRDSADLRRHWIQKESNTDTDANQTDIASLLPTLAERLLRANRIERDFDAALEDAKLRAMKELAYGASHEINNPLANISARAQTLLADESDPDRQKALAAINRQAFRAHEMIADMMLFAHPPRLEYTEFAVADLIDEVLTELKPDAERQGTTLHRNLDNSGLGAPPLLVTADRVQIGVAVKALTRNSLEALGQGGLVQVQVACAEIEGLPASESGVCVITITDDGPGISNEIRQHMFEPFFSGREAGRGLGFGLSKVWRIADQHGGSVTVSQTGGTDGTRQETCIGIHFPVVPESPKHEGAPIQARSASE